MKAVKCDCCGTLVEVENHIRIDLDLPTDEDEGETWQGIDICGQCLGRPMLEVLQASAEGFSFPWKRSAGDADGAT